MSLERGGGRLRGSEKRANELDDATRRQSSSRRVTTSTCSLIVARCVLVWTGSCPASVSRGCEPTPNSSVLSIRFTILDRFVLIYRCCAYRRSNVILTVPVSSFLPVFPVTFLSFFFFFFPLSRRRKVCWIGGSRDRGRPDTGAWDSRKQWLWLTVITLFVHRR